MKRAEAVCFDESGFLDEEVFQVIEPYTAQDTLSSTTKDEFMTLIEDVQMATGDEVVVMGTKSALASPKSQGVTRSTTGWATSAQVMTSTNKYLWCYHEFVLTNNNHLYTDATVIGVYGDKGDPGTTDYNGLKNKPVVNGAVTAYQSDIMKSQLRNVTFSTEEPKTTDGKPGDMWVVYGDE